MDRWRIFGVFLIVLASVALIAQLVIAPIAGQTTQLKVTGKVIDVVVKTFDATGLQGVQSIEYRRLSMSPGARMEGEFAFDGFSVLSVARKGSITVTFPNGSKATFKAGDIFTIPSGAKTRLIVADAKAGWEEFYWSINMKARR